MKKLWLVTGLAGFLSTLAAPAQAQKKDDLAVDFGPAGVWLRAPDGDSWQLDRSSPEEMASGDVDGNGQSDLVLDFPGDGVWIWLNNSRWLQVHTLNAAHIVTADLDGNGRAAVLLDFPGSGIWVWRNNGNWTQLHGLSPHVMATGDLDGNGRAEVLIDFTGYGVWVWTNNQSWSQLHPFNVRSMAVGDLDGNGRKDVVLDFPGYGTWVWGNNASWSQLHGLSASHITLADLDGNGRDEAILDFPGYGLWVWRNATGWAQLHALDAELLTAADLDGNGRSDLVIDFGAPGLWGWWNNASWTQLTSQSPEGSVAGNFSQRCDSALSMTTVTAFESGGNITVTVTGSCQWTATSNASFISIVSGSTGKGAGTVTFNVTPNYDGSRRSGTLTIAGQTVTVSQDAENAHPCFTVSPGTASVPVGGTLIVTFTSHCSNVNWTVTSNSSAVQLLGSSGGWQTGAFTRDVALKVIRAERVLLMVSYSPLSGPGFGGTYGGAYALINP